MSRGRLTLPIEEGMDEQLRALIARLGPDAVRNSDGTSLPEVASELVEKVYSTYFPGRGDQAWAEAHPQEATHIFLMSERVTAMGAKPLEIDIMRGYLAEQVEPELDCDTDKYWQVIDRTTGREVPREQWQIITAPDASVRVRLESPRPWHTYTVNFLARQIWDSTQMYNYITNNWQDDPGRVKERPYDVRYEATWEHVRGALAQWLQANPQVDVVRFTTFFYHFTLVFNDEKREKFVDWFGYSASVSVPALEAFAAEYGYQLTPEDFVDEGYYNSPFRPPRVEFKDWIDFQSAFVAARARELVEITHAAGREAMMFLGDNWIGVEPYGKHFPSIGLDAVVGSVGSGATCRMIADIPGVKYTEGRFLPYFFPDVFNPDGDPVGEANESWLTARRAIVRSPLDRIGYGGYLSLAVQFPEFIDRIEQIISEFRAIHERSGGERPANTAPRVAIVNAWGQLRSWQTHMVAHALWYKQIYTYLGVLEALAGLPVQVDFLSYCDLSRGFDPEIDVLIIAGAGHTAFAGGNYWREPALGDAIREFVARGGGIIGIGEPTFAPAQGSALALADLFGVDRELGWSLSTDRYPRLSDHFIIADLPRKDGQVEFTPGERQGDIVPISDQVRIHALAEGSVDIATNRFGRGRAVYLSGCAYSADNARLLHRAITWAGGAQATWDEHWWAADPRVEVAEYPGRGLVQILNNSREHIKTTLRCADREVAVELAPMQALWRELAELT